MDQPSDQERHLLPVCPHCEGRVYETNRRVCTNCCKGQTKYYYEKLLRAAMGLPPRQPGHRQGQGNPSLEHFFLDLKPFLPYHKHYDPTAPHFWTLDMESIRAFWNAYHA